MARSKGDLTRVTFSALVLFVAMRGDSDGDSASDVGLAFGIVTALCDRVANGDTEAERELDDLRTAWDNSTKGPAMKRGRKALVDKEAITREVLARFKQPNGNHVTPEYFAICPSGSWKNAIKARIDAEIAVAKCAALSAAA